VQFLIFGRKPFGLVEQVHVLGTVLAVRTGVVAVVRVTVVAVGVVGIRGVGAGRIVTRYGVVGGIGIGVVPVVRISVVAVTVVGVVGMPVGFVAVLLPGVFVGIQVRTLLGRVTVAGVVVFAVLFRPMRVIIILIVVHSVENQRLPFSENLK
jgi:hypothetical protein